MRLIKNALLILIITLIIFLFLEIFFRIVPVEKFIKPQSIKIGDQPETQAVVWGEGYLLPDIDLLWKLQANSSGKFLNGKEFKVNSFGFKSPEIEIEKPKNTKRLVCLGGSITHGSLLSQDESYPAVLQKELGDRWQVINTGVPGYSSFQGLAQFEKRIIPLKPDVITLDFGPNDAENAKYDDIKAQQILSSSLGRLSIFLNHESALYRFVRIFSLKYISRQNIPLTPRVPNSDFLKNIREIVKIAKENNIIVIILDANMEYSKYSDILRSISAEEKIDLVDLKPLLSQKEFQMEEFPTHLNKEGHIKVAGELNKILH